MKGLRAWITLQPTEALLLTRTRSVHTFGMSFPIDVVSLDGTMRVVSVRRMPPGRLLLPRPHVRHILECAPGADLRPGDVLLPE